MASVWGPSGGAQEEYVCVSGISGRVEMVVCRRKKAWDGRPRPAGYSRSLCECVCLALSALVVSHMSLLSALIARLCRVGIKLYMYCAAVMDVAAACVGEHRRGKQATQASNASHAS